MTGQHSRRGESHNCRRLSLRVILGEEGKLPGGRKGVGKKKIDDETKFLKANRTRHPGGQ